MRFRRRTVLAGLVVTALLVGAVFGAPSDSEPVLPGEHQLFQPADAGTHLWPYTSRSRSVDDRTLAINVIVYGDPDVTRRALLERSETNWTVAENDTVGESSWQAARGAARYTYVSVDPSITGRWFESEYQLATGTYLGQRVHIRAYPAPSNNWTAIQTHTEYWDWLRLRHTVTSVPDGARFLERDLRDEPFVEHVAREYHGKTGGGSDGWITIIEIDPRSGVGPDVDATPFVVGGVIGSVVPLAHRRRELLLDAALPLTLAGLIISVRVTGIALEQAFPGVNPKLFAALLYPLMVVGPPFLAAAFARGRPASRTAVLAAVGLGAGIVLDLGTVGATSVTVQFALHRVALVSALGLFALGIARRDGQTLGLGAVAWLLTLTLPLVGII